MIMAGLQFMGEVPFQEIMIHGTVRVEGGQKMSKALGNSIDPLEIIDEMGADALRFSLMMLAATDVYLSRQKFEMGRNFTNKLWNAFRFSMANLADFSPKDYYSAEKIKPAEFSVMDQWILTELEETKILLNQNLENFRFHEAANTLYHFFWHSFCDWYLELSKPVLNGTDFKKKKITQNVLIHVLENTLRLLHPMMPFITEELWQHLGPAAGIQVNVPSIMLASWPVHNASLMFQKEAGRVRIFQQAVTGVRDFRARLGLKPNEKLKGVSFAVKSADSEKALKSFCHEICFLAQLDDPVIQPQIEKKPGRVSKIYSHMEIFMEGLSQDDLKKECDKTRKKMAELEQAIRGIDSRLNNPGFVSKAPEDVVAGERQRRDDFFSQWTAHKENLELFQS